MIVLKSNDKIYAFRDLVTGPPGLALRGVALPLPNDEPEVLAVPTVVEPFLLMEARASSENFGSRLILEVESDLLAAFLPCF